MKVTVNGKEIEVEEGLMVGALVDRLVQDRSRVAVERNKEIVPKGMLDQEVLADGDVVEIVMLVGGG